MPLTGEQRVMRRTGIGSSDIGVLAGVSQYRRTPLDIYCDKLGLVETGESTEAMWWGHRLESFIASEFVRRSGFRLGSAAEAWPESVDGTVRSKGSPWMLATPDAVACADDGKIACLIECKNLGAHALARWGEGPLGVPHEYRCQVQWQMDVTGVPAVYLAVLFGGQTFRVYELESDPELGQLLWAIGRGFWHDHVLREVPPPLDASDGTRRYLQRCYPQPTGPWKTAPGPAERWAQQWQAADAVQREALRQKAEAEHQLMALIGESEGIECARWRAGWQSRRGAIDWKAAAESAGVSETEAEVYRRPGVRVFSFRTGRGEDHYG